MPSRPVSPVLNELYSAKLGSMGLFVHTTLGMGLVMKRITVSLNGRKLERKKLFETIKGSLSP